MKEFLITGANSGVGKYLHENLGGTGFTRKNGTRILSSGERFDTIIHCAYNASRDIDSENLYPYISDNILLTQKLLQLPHKKFIFFSTVDVYPPAKRMHKENEILNLNEVVGMYAITKLISESLVRNRTKNFLILRPTGLLGTYSKKGSLMKILFDEKPKITLTRDSEVNCTLYTDILAFIRLAVEKNIKGIYNIGSSRNITPEEVAELMKKKISYGKFAYQVGNYDISQAAAVVPEFKKTSKDAIRLFLTS